LNYSKWTRTESYICHWQNENNTTAETKQESHADIAPSVTINIEPEAIVSTDLNSSFDNEKDLDSDTDNANSFDNDSSENTDTDNDMDNQDDPLLSDSMKMRILRNLNNSESSLTGSESDFI